MDYKLLHGNVKIPALGLGTWQIGGRLEADHSSDEESIQAMKKAIGLGYTLIDTAELYGAGHTEELVGKAISHVDRKKLFIVSKVMALHLSYNDVITAAKKSLERLQTAYFDLYLIHLPNPDIPIKETMMAMDYLVEQGLTRFIGVSNFSVKEMQEAQRWSKNKIVVNQIQYSLISRNKSTYCDCVNMESEIIPYCQENDIIIMADRPLHKGELLGKNHPVISELCKKYKKTASQIALNWLISKKNIITIPKSTNIEHLKENLGAMNWELDKEDADLLDTTDFEVA
ncbi:aldo/keto reductase [Candidatus Woesearchaeota archaeon]|nr:aldo/keto reductase [Candidatus Woesearchaeota archaeon]